jgi:aminoglycoside phosphotransferase (APT) family kinase protein
VFRDGQPVALIDFDAAAPGSRAFDLGYAAWLWLDVGAQHYSADEQLGRQLFADTALARRYLVDRQRIVTAEAERFGKTGIGQWAATCHRWTIAHLRRAKRSLERMSSAKVVIHLRRGCRADGSAGGNQQKH